ncbi:hypothetical protein Cgig2_018441 [Carnegiea gigantea]|uniref:GPI-anchored protein LLG1-like domain-containing protein n=1 Tax=Carnegiea gigantea TaxID=171969 RepID=A0A9Q1JGF2_9CARY|nr:hypothetical protein Cgig2_018441 [Carnegiea gigantea]
MGMGTKEEHRRWIWINSFCCSTSSGLISAIFIVLVLFVGISSATPLSISACPVSFENLNYTIITSRCKGPKYPPKECCNAFKDFACPYADELNDPQNNCATTMFSYINLYGKYPPGLFANECRDSKRGLECTDAQANPPKPYSAAPSRRLPLLILSAVAALWHCALI